MATAATVNRADEHEQIGKAAGPCVMVLFGASGDLTKRKLVPALFNLVKAKLLPRNFAVVGVAFDALSRDQFREQVTGFLHPERPGRLMLRMRRLLARARPESEEVGILRGFLHAVIGSR